MQEYLKELSNKKIKLDDLIEKVYPIEKAPEAYEELQKPAKPIGVLLEYPKELPENLGRLYQDSSRIYTGTSKVAPKTGVVKIAIVGAGSFIKNTHIPNLLKLKDKFKICAVMSKTPYNAKQTAQLCGADYATCNLDDVLADAQIDLIFIGSPHNLHGAQILSALKAGKNVFVEKPLCVAQEELQAIKDFYSEKVSQNTPAPLLTVGFNRRFSPMAREAKIHTSKRINPLYLHYRMNAGFLPATHWVNQEEGAGRIIGEACHAVDLCTFFTESKVRGINVSSLSPKTQSVSGDDNKVIVLSYEDGSVATLEYFSVGSRAYPKEYVEIHFDEKTIVIDDFKSVNGYGLRLPSASDGSFRKGHFEELSALYDSLTRPKEKWPIELWDMIQTTEICILAARK
ncbi:MAG: Gfo/Idh/MocA family oxidoreductase [Candidatus Omnitrophica bacterium]|nr:Gfo/Idh/MocA family oxidoreductase [Candidatus Omnitrophota bacterium]